MKLRHPVHISHIRMRRVNCHKHIWMSHSINIHESWVRDEWPHELMTHVYVCYTYEWVVAYIYICVMSICHEHIWTVTNTYDRVTANIWMSHSIHIHEPCHTHDWVMSHTYAWAMSRLLYSRVTHVPFSARDKNKLANLFLCVQQSIFAKNDACVNRLPQIVDCSRHTY